MSCSKNSLNYDELRNVKNKACSAGNGGSIGKQCNAALGASGLARRESLQCDSAALQPLNMEPPCLAGCASQIFWYDQVPGWLGGIHPLFVAPLAALAVMIPAAVFSGKK